MSQSNNNHSLYGGLLRQYLSVTPADQIEPGAAAFFGSLDAINAVSPNIARSIISELNDQRANIKLIASENY